MSQTKKFLYVFGCLSITLLNTSKASTLQSQVAQMVELQRTNEGCRLNESYTENLVKKASALKGKGKAAQLVFQEIQEDLSASSCAGDFASQRQELLGQVAARSSHFPASIFEVAFDKDTENAQDQSALGYLKTLETKACPELEFEQRHSFKTWHQLILEAGWPCSVKNYQQLSRTLNLRNGFDFQTQQRELEALSLRELKRRFKETFRNDHLSIAFFPQLGWENGVVNTTFPYTLITDETEKTTYRFLQKEFRKLGMKTELVSRNSVAALDEQVSESLERLEKFEEKKIIISRSMGSRVVRELIHRYPDLSEQKIKAWLNIGGTPHGSFIAQYKSQKDYFYAGHLPMILEALKAPLRLIQRDPRIPNHLFEVALEAHRRSSIATLSPVTPSQLDTSIPIFNAVFLRSDYQRATSGVDPVWREMLLYGASEGSAPLNGAAVESSTSLHLIEQGDHLSFWALSQNDALRLYLKYLILARLSGQI